MKNYNDLIYNQVTSGSPVSFPSKVFLLTASGIIGDMLLLTKIFSTPERAMEFAKEWSREFWDEKKQWKKLKQRGTKLSYICDANVYRFTITEEEIE